MTEVPNDSYQPDLSLVVPCFNEEEVLANTVHRLVRSFVRTNTKLEVVLVDNGSADRTGQAIDGLIAEGLPVVKNVVKINEGYGNGVLSGLRCCRGRLVGFTTADGQVDSEEVVKLYEVAAGARTPCLVKVRRRFRMDGLTRKVVSIIYNISINLLFGGLGSIDINGNPKILPRAFVDRMNLQSKDWFLDAEIMLKAKKLNLKVLEFNVLGQMREGGSSHVRVGTCWEFVKNLIKYRLAGPEMLAPSPEVESNKKASTKPASGS